MPNKDELSKVTFHREVMLLRPTLGNLPGLDDADEHKLPSLDKLLRQMNQVFVEFSAAGLNLQNEPQTVGLPKSQYRLTDAEYEEWPKFEIIIRSNWLDPQYPFALHAGFDFYLDVIQDGFQGRGEIADWITIRISHLHLTPIAFGSYREHVRALVGEGSYFSGLSMQHTSTVSFDRLDDGMNLNADRFSQAVDDACLVLQKLVSRKEFLRALPGL